MADHPFWEVAATAHEHVLAGRTIFQKFTCAKCGARQTMPDENAFYMKGTCEECGHTTDLVERGCNYMLIMSAATGAEAAEILAGIAKHGEEEKDQG